MNMPLTKKANICGKTYRGGDLLPDNISAARIEEITGIKQEKKKEIKETKYDIKKTLKSFDIKKEVK